MWGSIAGSKFRRWSCSVGNHSRMIKRMKMRTKSWRRVRNRFQAARRWAWTLSWSKQLVPIWRAFIISKIKCRFWAGFTSFLLFFKKRWWCTFGRTFFVPLNFWWFLFPAREKKGFLYQNSSQKSSFIFRSFIRSCVSRPSWALASYAKRCWPPCSNSKSSHRSSFRKTRPRFPCRQIFCRCSAI